MNDMIKILKTDLFRLFKSKAFYVYPIVVVIIMMIGMLFSVNTDTHGDHGHTITESFDCNIGDENVEVTLT